MKKVPLQVRKSLEQEDLNYLQEELLFLDEIGDISLSLQAKLLRALENKSIQKVGGGKEIPLDLRMVCATHQDLEKKLRMEVLEQTYITELMFFL